MTKDYPSIFKIAIAALLALAAIFVPFTVVRIILAFAALIIFAVSLKKFTGLLITLSVIFVLVPAIVLTAIGSFGNMAGLGRWISESINANGFHFGGISSSSAPHRTIQPDTYIQGAKDLYVKVTGLNVEFDSSTDTVYLSKRLNVIREGDILRIVKPTGDWNNTTFYMVVGTANKFSKVTIDTVGVKASGSLTADDVKFDSVGIDSNTDITSGTLVFNGVGIDVNGKIDSKRVTFDGVGVKVGIDLKSATSVDMHGTSINGYVKYLGEWEGDRHLTLDSLGGNLTVWVSSGNPGNLTTTKTGGMVNVSLLKY